MKIYECLLAGDVRGLHPMQISRETGISYREVARRLDATPELFVRLVVARGSHRRYALHTRARAMQRRDVQQLLDRGVLRESLILYLVGAFILFALIWVVLSAISMSQQEFTGF
ncbi:MAG: hypothetical protein OXF72_09135 [Gammaproteobacteria bacterium]|nr:hypothetical protein [Gammaproteobacteria bacterium]MCY4198966.1 hypothetical protein [Gammaproteobacteria bacterium]MCY4277680.1 hypothetical protein [Gammaproteobacteria bacterium]MCY4323316.1 hypothetical protein [Gammaproteobacteria bacterium]